MKNSQEKIDLTLIIPTFERHFIIKRLSTFYENKPYKVLILDGSKNSINHKFASNVRYIWSGNTYEERLRSSLKYIDTKYVCMIGDDEFHFLESLKESIVFLEKNNQFSSCSGFPISHYSYSFSGIKKLTDFDSFFSSRLAKTPYKFENKCYSNSSERRFRYHYEEYQPRFVYSVTRIEIWKAAMDTIQAATQEIKALGLYELSIDSAIFA
ncbi:TIGR00180 family glycosyltransferase, partial [Prochlorococcus sp. AH-716-B20]|nr:TIGR00180 family glycosyltransferase [Prochlorococcus sp. AH-716-B20]